MVPLGYILYAIGAVDLLLYNVAGVDLTGVAWSPIVAFVAGSALVKAGSPRT